MKIETKSVHRIDYCDFEALVNDPDTYGFEERVTVLGGGHEMRDQAYSFVADIECGNDSSHEYGGITKADAEDHFKDEQEDFDNWKNTNGRGGQWMVHAILLDFVRRDLIPEGDYVISVCW